MSLFMHWISYLQITEVQWKTNTWLSGDRAEHAVLSLEMCA